MRTNPDLSYIVSGGAVSQDYSNAGTLQLYDSDDANWLVHSILAELNYEHRKCKVFI